MSAHRALPQLELATPELDLCLTCSAQDCRIIDRFGHMSVCSFYSKRLTSSEATIMRNITSEFDRENR